MLNKEEKQELLNLAHSPKLKRDFRQIEENRYNLLLKNGKVNLDEYIRFLTFSNAMINHRLRLFKKIKGRNFKI
jgi:hypothetical protein